MAAEREMIFQVGQNLTLVREAFINERNIGPAYWQVMTAANSDFVAMGAGSNNRDNRFDGVGLNAARGILRVNNGQNSYERLFDWGQTFNLTAESVDVDLFFPQQLPALTSPERYSASVRRQVAGDGRSPLHYTNSVYALAAAGNTVRPIPPGTDYIEFAASPVAPAADLAPFLYQAYIVDGLTALAAIQWTPLTSVPRLIVPRPGSGTSSAATLLLPRAVQVFNRGATAANLAIRHHCFIP